MKIVQKILSHGLLIAFVAAAFLAYTNRSEWFPQWFDKTGNLTRPATDSSPGTASSSARSKQAPAQSVREEPVSRAPTAAVATPDVPAPERAVAEEHAVQAASAVQADSAPEAAAPENGSETEAHKVVEPVAQAQPSGDAPQVQPAIAETQPDLSPVVANPGAPSHSQQAEETTVREQPAQAGEGDQTREAPPQAVSSQDSQLEKKLEEARQLYWKRDMQGAMEAYRVLSEEYPDNPDVWGEVGNFYFSARQRTPAANAYFRCIELLINQGEQERAYQLLSVLYKLDAPRARELETRMQQAGG